MLLDHSLKHESHLFYSLSDAIQHAQRLANGTSTNTNAKEFTINGGYSNKLTSRNTGFKYIFQKVDNNNTYHLIGSDDSTTYVYQSDME